MLRDNNLEAAGAGESILPENKGSPVCISTSIHPKLHMSMARSYGIPSKTSGDR